MGQRSQTQLSSPQRGLDPTRQEIPPLRRICPYFPGGAGDEKGQPPGPRPEAAQVAGVSLSAWPWAPMNQYRPTPHPRTHQGPTHKARLLCEPAGNSIHTAALCAPDRQAASSCGAKGLNTPHHTLSPRARVPGLSSPAKPTWTQGAGPQHDP